MAYDEDLADRVRQLVGGEAGFDEKKMFGGLAFLLDGTMAVSASRRGGLMVRVDPAESDDLVTSTGATAMIMRGRAMRGWLYVEPEDVRTKAELAAWVDRGVAYARTLADRSDRTDRRS